MAAVAMAALLRPVHADAWSPARRRLVAAAIALGADGVLMGTRFLASVESPLHANFKQAILDSLAKTNRLVIAEEGWPTCSIASEVTAICMEEGFDHLDAPVTRVCNEDVPLPYAANLEKLALIDTPRIVAAAKKVCYRD